MLLLPCNCWKTETQGNKWLSQTSFLLPFTLEKKIGDDLGLELEGAISP
jgi:hypothetical protein